MSEWKDQAMCKGWKTVWVPPDLCRDCTVTAECGALYEEISFGIDNGTVRAIKMPGIWGGERRASEPQWNKKKYGGGRYKKGTRPVNGGSCTEEGCKRGAHRRGICSMHYQRIMTARRKEST